MSNVKIGDFLQRSKIPIEIEDGKYYNRVTIRGNHNGISLRDTEIGKSIGTKKQFILKAGQFVMSKIDARYGAFGIAPEETDGAIITGNFWAYDVDKSKVNIDWFNQFTNSKSFYDVCERASTGITHRKYLNETSFLNYKMFLPTIEEQLFQIEIISTKSESFGIITSELTHQLTLVKQLRQAFLSEAMQGKLVESGKLKVNKGAEEMGQQLLERIRKEKQKLIKSGKLKKEKPLPPIKPEEIPFEIPQDWVWCRLGEIVEHTFYGPRFSNSDYVKTGIPTIRTTDMSERGVIELKDAPMIKLESQDKIDLYKIRHNDLLITRTGSIGTMALFKSDYLAIPSAYLIRCRFLFPEMADFLFKILKSNFSLDYFGLNTKTGTRPNINAVSISNLIMPLPPLSTQQRIVEKLDQLMSLCDGLESSIKSSKEQNELLLQEVLREAMEGRKYEIVGEELGMAAEKNVAYKI